MMKFNFQILFLTFQLTDRAVLFLIPQMSIQIISNNMLLKRIKLPMLKRYLFPFNLRQTNFPIYFILRIFIVIRYLNTMGSRFSSFRFPIFHGRKQRMQFNSRIFLLCFMPVLRSMAFHRFILLPALNIKQNNIPVLFITDNFKRREHNQMSSNFIRAGQSGGRKAAIREELLPSSIPLPKPTRDVSASNRSHSILHPTHTTYSQPRIIDKSSEDLQLQKKANIEYTHRFKSLAKILGNESMNFEEVKLKVENLVLKDEIPNTEGELRMRIQQLQRQLLKNKDQHRSSSQYIGSLKAMETQLNRKNKLLSQFSNSIKRQTFEEAYKELSMEVDAKQQSLRSMEEQMHDVRIKSASQIGTLEEEIIKRNQTIQKLTFQLDTLKRKHQGSLQENERSKKREKELLNNFQVQTKASYQGISYSTNALLLQLQSRDAELNQVISQQRANQEQIQQLEEQLLSYKNQFQSKDLAVNELKANVDYYEKVASRQNQQLQLLKEEHETSKKREQDLHVNIQSLSQVSYQGNSYTLPSLLQFLDTKDKEVIELKHQHNLYQEQNSKLKEDFYQREKQQEQYQKKIEELQKQLVSFEEMAQVLHSKMEESQRQNQILKQREQQYQVALEKPASVNYQGTSYDIHTLIQEFQQKNAFLTQTTSEEHQQLQAQLSQLQSEKNGFYENLQQQLEAKKQIEQNRQTLFEQNKHLLVHIQKLKENEANFINRLNELQTIQQTHIEQEKKLFQQIQILRQNEDKARAQAIELSFRKDIVAQEQQELKSQVEALRQHEASYRNQMSELEGKVAELEERRQQLVQEQEKMIFQMKTLQQNQSSYRNMVSQLEGRAGQLEQQRQLFEQDQQALHEEIQKLKQNEQSYKVEVTQLQSSKQQLLEQTQTHQAIFMDIQRFKENEENIKTQVNQLENQRNNHKAVISDLESALQQQRAKHEQTAFNFKQIQDQLVLEIQARNKVQINVNNHEQVTINIREQNEEQMGSLQQRSEDLVQDKQSLVEQIRTHNVNISNKDQEIKGLLQKINFNTENQLKLQNQLAQYQHKNAFLEEEMNNYRNQIETYTIQIQKYNEEILALHEEVKQKPLLLQKLQEYQQNEEQLASLRIKVEEKDYQVSQSTQHFDRINQLQEQISSIQEQEKKLRMLLDEATDKERQYESNAQAQSLELQQIRIELHQTRQYATNQKQEMAHKIDLLHEQLDHEKARLQELMQLKAQEEQELNQLRQNYQQMEYKHLKVQSQAQNQKQNSSTLNQKITEINIYFQNQQKLWNQEKSALQQQIEELRQEKYQQEIQYKNQVERAKTDYSQQRQMLEVKINEIQANMIQLAQEKQSLSNHISELSEKQQQSSPERNQPSLSHQLQNCTFNYYSQSEERQVVQESSEHPDKTNTELHLRIEELQARVDELEKVQQTKQFIQNKENDLIYSKSFEGQNDLRTLVNSLQEEKEKVQLLLEKIKKEELEKLQSENEALRLNEKQLSEKLKQIEGKIDEKDEQLYEMKKIQAKLTGQLAMVRKIFQAKQLFSSAVTTSAQPPQQSTQELIEIRSNQKQLEQKNISLIQQISIFQKELEIIKTQRSILEQTELERRQLKDQELELARQQIEQHKEKYQKLTQERTQIEGLAQNALELQQQMEKIQLELTLNRETKLELEKKCQELELQNQQLSSRIREDEEEHQRVLSKLSRKSNVEDKQVSSKKQFEGSEQPSSDGQLTRKILNDPSKISGQESKFSPSLIFNPNQSHINKQTVILQTQEHQQIIQENEIKEQRNEESVLSKTLQERQSSKQITERKSQTSKKQTSNKNISEKEISEKKIQTDKKIETQSNKRQTSFARSVAEQKHITHYSAEHQFRNDIQFVNSQHERIEIARENQQEEGNVGQEQNKKEEYLPQHSSKKTVSQQNDSKKQVQEYKLEPQPSVKPKPSESFHKKMPSGTISPVYVAKPTVIQRTTLLQRAPEVMKRDSQSRSNSNNKIKISYGQSQKSFQIINKKVIPQERNEMSRQSSQFNSMIKPNHSINEISPVPLRRSELHQSSLRSSLFRPDNNQSKLVGDSYIKPPERLQSESIINRISGYTNGYSAKNISIRPPPNTMQKIPSTKTIVQHKQSVPSYISPKIDYLSPQTSRSNQLTFTTVKGSQSPSIRQSTVVHNSPPQLQTPVNVSKTSNEENSTPKITMKKVSSGRRNNSGFGDTISFGTRTFNNQKEDISSSSDSGIDIMQYDWAAPCCKNQS